MLLAFYLASKEHSVLKIDIKLGNGLLQAINFFFNRKNGSYFIEFLSPESNDTYF